jgi:hypothetical protein
MTYDDLISKTSLLRREYPQLRFGQALMNVLSKEDPQLYSIIHCTEADCFYDDKKINLFFEKVIDAMP